MIENISITIILVSRMTILANYMATEAIKIKKENKGKFTEYCIKKGYGGVTEACIEEGLKDKDPKVRQRANFVKNARKFNHKKKKK